MYINIEISFEPVSIFFYFINSQVSNKMILIQGLLWRIVKKKEDVDENNKECFRCIKRF